jgi:hypothetical protein
MANVRFPGVRCAHPWLTSVVPFGTKCGRRLLVESVNFSFLLTVFGYDTPAWQ